MSVRVSAEESNKSGRPRLPRPAAAVPQRAGGASDFDLAADFDDGFGGDPEIEGGRRGVAVHHREQFFPPAGHARLLAGDDPLDPEDLARPMGLDHPSFPELLAVGEDTRDGLTVLAPRLPGHGTSWQDLAVCRWDDFHSEADRALTTLRERCDQVVVLGLSVGGALALQIALDRPHQIDRLVLVNTFASLRPKNFAVRAYFVYRFLVVCILGLSSQAQVVARRVFPHPEQEELRQVFYSQIMQADARGYRAAMLALAFFDVKKRLPEIKAPTLVITGQEDTTVPPDTQMVLAKGIQNAQHMIIPGAGHAVIVEKHQLFNQVLLKFLLSICISENL